MPRTALQRRRSLTQSGFFILFVLAPVLDIFRYDLTQGHFIVFGQAWTLGIDAFLGADDAFLNLLLRGMLPLLVIAGGFLWVAWRWGRLYCGWLCPHYSVVEWVNELVTRATGKPSLWEPRCLPRRRPDGSQRVHHPAYWGIVVPAVVAFAFLWALSLLTYLMPPYAVYHDLLLGQPGRNQALFLGVATAVFCTDFLFARHLFCRYGCAVGLFQSLAWMANRSALVVSFDRSRAPACRECNNACDNACPMRLQPRSAKRKMFTCTECGECITACTRVQARHGRQPLLTWVQGEAAHAISAPVVDAPRWS